MLYHWSYIQYSRMYLKSIFKVTSRSHGNTEAVDVYLRSFAIMTARPVLNCGLILAFSLLEACLGPKASILPPRSCSYLSMTFWFPGLDPWSSVCFCLNSAINS